MTYKPINFQEKFSLFQEVWSPKVVAEMNNYQFKLVKIKGEFVWHQHTNTDEAFVVLDGEMTIAFRDGEVTLRSGEMFVVPKGVEHKPFAEKECRILIIEPNGIVNTGNTKGELTAENNVYV